MTRRQWWTALAKGLIDAAPAIGLVAWLVAVMWTVHLIISHVQAVAP